MRHSLKSPSSEGDDLLIDRKALDELHQLALEQAPKIAHLSYREAQQLLTLHSLVRYFESFGLKAPFKLDVK